MDTSPSKLPSTPSSTGLSMLRDVLTDAVRFWERGRIGYNLILAAIVAGWAAFTWPHFRGALSWQPLLMLSVLAVLANICYSAAYFVDVPLQLTAFRDSWRRWRWVLWVLGMTFAAAIAFYWIADEIYPSGP
jgi:hypothetical protein